MLTKGEITSSERPQDKNVHSVVRLVLSRVDSDDTDDMLLDQRIQQLSDYIDNLYSSDSSEIGPRPPPSLHSDNPPEYNLMQEIQKAVDKIDSMKRDSDSENDISHDRCCTPLSPIENELIQLDSFEYDLLEGLRQYPRVNPKLLRMVSKFIDNATDVSSTAEREPPPPPPTVFNEALPVKQKSDSETLVQKGSVDTAETETSSFFSVGRLSKSISIASEDSNDRNGFGDHGSEIHGSTQHSNSHDTVADAMAITIGSSSSLMEELPEIKEVPSDLISMIGRYIDKLTIEEQQRDDTDNFDMISLPQESRDALAKFIDEISKKHLMKQGSGEAVDRPIGEKMNSSSGFIEPKPPDSLLLGYCDSISFSVDEVWDHVMESPCSHSYDNINTWLERPFSFSLYNDDSQRFMREGLVQEMIDSIGKMIDHLNHQAGNNVPL